MNIETQIMQDQPNIQNDTQPKDIAISVHNVSKKFKLYETPYARVQELLSLGFKRLHHEFWALKDISFDIPKGSTVGIIGKNGSGKSTLLKLICGITHPTSGKINVNGRISSLLEVGVGFNPQLTGRDNIYLQGALMGYSKEEMKERAPLIEEFADIGEYIDQPVMHYSSGMAVRLVFSCAINVDPDILIVDEALAVGDAAFQKKCYSKIQNFKENNKTILLISHDLTVIRNFCDQVYFLNNGNLVKYTSQEEAIQDYLVSILGVSNNSIISELNFDVGDEHARLLYGSIKDYNENIVKQININESFYIEMKFEILNDSNLYFFPNMHLYSEDGTCVFVVAFPKDQNESFNKKGIYIVRCNIPANYLNDKKYKISLALTSIKNFVTIHFWEKDVISFQIIDTVKDIKTRETGYSGTIPGVVRPILEWDIIS